MTAAVQRPLGRIWLPDDRDANYAMEPILAATRPPVLPAKKSWPLGPVMNQGATSQCCAYATSGWLQAAPIETMDGPSPQQIYTGAQALDGIKGPHSGTTVRGAFQYMRALGRLESFVWAQSAQSVMEWLLTKGTIVFGWPWMSGFDEPTAEGQLKLTGLYRGGHSILGYQCERDSARVWIRNSWGPWGWQNEGDAWIAAEDLDTMLTKMRAEAGAGIEEVPNPAAEQPAEPEDPR